MARVPLLASVRRLSGRSPIRRALLRLPISGKINLSYVIVSILLMTVLVIASVRFSSNVIVASKIEDAQRGIDLLLDGFDVLFDSLENYSKIAVTNPQLQEILRRIWDTGGKVSFADATAIRLILDNIIYPKSSVDAMVLKDSFGNLFTTSQIVVTEPPRYQILLYDQTERYAFWVDTHAAGYRTGDRTDIVLSLVRMFYDSYSGAPLGLLETSLQERVIANRYSEAGLVMPWEVFITNRSGFIVSDSDPAMLKRDVRDAISPEAAAAILQPGLPRTIRVGGEPTVVLSRSYPRLGWLVVAMIRERVMLGNITVLVLRILAIGLVCLLLTLLLSALISRSITRPLAELTAAVKGYSHGAPFPPVRIGSRDEIGTLSVEFRRMTRRNSDLMQRLIEDRDRVRQYELALLQSQINPHFLYNTFEVICSLAELGRDSAIIDMVTTLASFYRTVLSGGRQLIPLEREIELTRQYLKILSIRYEDRFGYRFDVDRAAFEVEIPKLTIQPLVENCIQHGIRNKEGRGTIVVTAVRDGDRVRVSVEDDGVGMSPERVAEVLAGTASSLPDASARGTGLGIRSIIDRLKLTFGEGCRVALESRAGEGTRVAFSIPIRPRAAGGQPSGGQPGGGQPAGEAGSRRHP